MSRPKLATLALAGLLSAGAVPAAAQSAGGTSRIGMAAATTAGNLRITLNLPSAMEHSLRRNGDQVEIRFVRSVDIDTTPIARLPPHLLGYEATPDGLMLRLGPGVRLRRQVNGKRLVLELTDPKAPQRPGAAGVPAAAQQQPASRMPASAQQPVAGAGQATNAPAPTAPTAGAPEAAPRPVGTPAPATAAPPPVPLVPAAVPSAPAGSPGTAPAAPPIAPITAAARTAQAVSLRLPFGPRTGAAAFVRGGALVMVFDEPRELDQVALARAVPGVEVLPQHGATVLRLPLGSAPALRRDGDAWHLSTANAEPPRAIVAEHGREGATRLVLAAEGASRSVVLPDPETGGLLLVGTIAGPPAAVAEARRFVAFDLLPTRLGVALALRSDEPSLRAGPGGFAVPLSPTGPLTLAPPPRPGEAVAMRVERVLDLPAMSTDALLERRQRLLADLSATPVLGRGPRRVDVAEVLLALGLPAEAQSLMQLAASEDPRLGTQPRGRMVLAAAATMAGRPQEAAEALGAPGLPDAGEPAFWRGLVQAGAVGSAAPAAFVAAAPIVHLYPAAMRARLLPVTALALAEGGALAAAGQMLDQATPELRDAPLARYAAARLAELRGDTSRALEGYRALASSRDSDARARALVRIPELRLATGEMDAQAAAAALEAAIPAWRGDDREFALRLRAAELRGEAGQPREALALLTETEAVFPDNAAQMRDRLAAAAVAFAAHPDTPALDAARVLSERREMLPPGPELDAALARVSDKLIAMEMQGEAAALLRRTPARAEQGGLSVRLGEALLADGDAGGALSTLRRGEAAPPLPAELERRRSLAEARARSETGDVAGATSVLRNLGRDGDAPLSELLARQREWAGAAEALARHADANLPAAPAPLDADAQQTVLRLAAFLTLAEDEAGLTRLRARFGAQMAATPVAAAFATVTGPGGGNSPDLRRLRAEIAQARSLPQQLRTLR